MAREGVIIDHDIIVIFPLVVCAPKDHRAVFTTQSYTDMHRYQSKMTNPHLFQSAFVTSSR